MKVLCKCKHCNNEYYAKSADLKRGWGKACSKSCAAIIRTGKQRKHGRIFRINYENSHPFSSDALGQW